MNKKLSKLFYRGMWHRKKRSSRCVYSDNAGIIFYNMYIAFSGKYVSMAGGGEFYEIRKLVCNAKRWRAIQYFE